jgi:hypothetical protein
MQLVAENSLLPGNVTANINSSNANANNTSTNGHIGGIDVIDYRNRAAREKELLGATTIMSMPSKTSYQE